MTLEQLKARQATWGKLLDHLRHATLLVDEMMTVEDTEIRNQQRRRDRARLRPMPREETE